MDEWQESGPGSDPRYVERDSSWLGRHKLWIAAIFLLVGIIVTAVELFRPREQNLSLEVAEMVEPPSQPDAAANFAEQRADYLPEKSPEALNLSPEGASNPVLPIAASAEPGPSSSPERRSSPVSASPPSAAPAVPAVSKSAPAPPPVAPTSPSAAPAVAKPAQVAKPKPVAGDRPAAKNDGSSKTWWVINIASTTEASDAEKVFKRLRDSGHTVYSYQTEVDDRIWHRIRIGFFSSQAEARKIGEALAKQHNLSTPWVVRPGPDELKTYKK